CIGFLQHPDNLLFTEPRFLHDKVSPAALPLTLQWDTSEGKGQDARHLPLCSAAFACSFASPSGIRRASTKHF
ncbi:hypothetical protein, partial [Burkholderia sp. Tr-20390]|uniref:hypothetical protein n=1 Tax=Burkholderia sp. Tr-20390 TaxID=2703904 RepID=UPI00197EBEF3